MAQRAYARHRAELGLSGTTHRAVQKAIERGRISKNADGLIDPEAADKAWADNTSEGHRRNPGQEEATQGARAAAARAPAVAPAPTPTDGPAASEPVVPRAATPEAITFNRANAMERGYRAKIAQLDFEERSGKLVDAEKVKAAWSQIVSIARNKVLGLPSKIKNQIPEITMPQIQVIERLVVEALEDLANGVG